MTTPTRRVAGRSERRSPHRSSVAVRRTADMVLSIQRHIGAQHRPLQTVPVDLASSMGPVDGPRMGWSRARAELAPTG